MIPTDRKLRVLVLGTTFPVNAGDGTPEFVLTLSEALAAKGHQVSVLVPQVPGGRREEIWGPVHVHRFRYFLRRYEDLADGAIVPNLKAKKSRWLQMPFLILAFWIAARRQVKRQDVDVVHAHWLIPAGLIARLLGRPYVVTAHGGDAYALSGRIFDRIRRFAASKATNIVPVSEAIGVKLASLGVTIAPAVPMGVDIDAIGEAIGERRPVDGRILFVGRLVEKKGVDDLLRALARLPSAHLHVVGDGPSRIWLEELAAELGVTDRATFMGKQPKSVVLSEMATAAVTALPSKVGEVGDQDGVPVVLSEAMAAQLPVVSSDAGGLSEHVTDGENGWLVPAGDVVRLTAALEQALKDPEEATRRAVLARERMVARLGIHAVSGRYLDLLRAAADQ